MDASVFPDTFSSLHAVLFPAETKQLQFYVVLNKLSDTKDELLEVVSVHYKSLFSILVAIVLNIRAFFTVLFEK